MTQVLSDRAWFISDRDGLGCRRFRFLDSGSPNNKLLPAEEGIQIEVNVNLLACQKAVIQEWRLLLANEDGATVCSKLNE